MSKRSQASDRSSAVSSVEDYAPYAAEDGRLPTGVPAALVLLDLPGEDGESRLTELKALCSSAGYPVVAELRQHREHPHPKTYVGTGKLDEVGAALGSHGAALVVTDRELSPTQLKELEETLEVPVADRTRLILELFAQRAHSREGKLQVRLAGLKYALSHLVGLGPEMSRLGGGVGTRGPGEPKLRAERSRLRRQIHLLEERMRRLADRRSLARSRRKEAEVPTVGIIGYTNGGKSTLLNALAGAAVAVDDRLFATLDPTSRLVFLPSGRHMILTDTVGFIRDLPKDLFAAFRATIEEATEADLLLHLVDASDSECLRHIEAVERTLKVLSCERKTRIMVLNKIDRATRLPAIDQVRPEGGEPPLFVSALTGQGLPELLLALDEALAPPLYRQRLWVTYEQLGKVKALLGKEGLLSETDEDSGAWLEVEATPKVLSQVVRLAQRASKPA